VASHGREVTAGAIHVRNAANCRVRPSNWTTEGVKYTTLRREGSIPRNIKSQAAMLRHSTALGGRLLYRVHLDSEPACRARAVTRFAPDSARYSVRRGILSVPTSSRVSHAGWPLGVSPLCFQRGEHQTLIVAESVCQLHRACANQPKAAATGVVAVPRTAFDV
jgi:hypothetical protein